MCMKTSSDSTGVMILRLWIEADHESGLRARITQTTGSMRSARSVDVAASVEDICTVVRGWIEAFEAQSPKHGAEEVPSPIP